MTRGGPLLWAGVAVVLVWRVATFVRPHPALTDPELVRFLMVPLGLWFLGWGLWAFRTRPGAPTLLLAWYGVSAAIHWGGAPGFGASGVQDRLLATYVVASTVGESFFLHLAILATPRFRVSRNRVALAFVYAPGMAGVILLALQLIAPTQISVQWFTLVLLLGSVYSLIGGLIWVARLVGADACARRQQHLWFVVAALLLGSLPQPMASALGIWPDYNGVLNLGLGVIPMALAMALVRPGPQRRPRPGVSDTSGVGEGLRAG